LPPPLDAAESLLGRALIAGRPVVLDARSGDDSEAGDLLTALDDPGQYLAGVGMDDAAPLRMGADFGSLPFATQLCVPLLAPRSIVGGLCVYSREPRLFGEEAISLLLAFAREGAIAIENAQLYEEARHGMEMQTLLLREMHHRVRNNLQRTASLLRMQANRMPDSPARHALQESVIRIQSIARVHDLLSHEQVGLTDISAVTGLVCEVVQNTLGRPDLYISIAVDNDPDLLLSSREAFPLTLLLTECLSNSLLHGFAGRETGIIQIAAHLLAADNIIELTVTDNGVGLRPGFDPERDSHLGLEVIRRLGEQELGGRIRIGPNPDGPGTRTVFRFPYQRPTGPTPTEADREMALKGIR
jgi:two-component sensor histidine kinase